MITALHSLIQMHHHHYLASKNFYYHSSIAYYRVSPVASHKPQVDIEGDISTDTSKGNPSHYYFRTSSRAHGVAVHCLRIMIQKSW